VVEICRKADSCTEAGCANYIDANVIEIDFRREVVQRQDLVFSALSLEIVLRINHSIIRRIYAQ
jgi:hypothetical protein